MKSVLQFSILKKLKKKILKKNFKFSNKIWQNIKISHLNHQTMQRKHMNSNQISGRNSLASHHIKQSSCKNNCFLTTHCWRLGGKTKKISDNGDPNFKLYHLHCHTTNGICHQVVEVNICSGPLKNCAFAWKRKLRQYRTSHVIFTRDENEEIILPSTEREFSIKSQRLKNSKSIRVINNNSIEVHEATLLDYDCKEEKQLKFVGFEPALTEPIFVCLEMGEGGKS